MEIPSNESVPDDGISSKLMQRRRVLLPDPLAPMIAISDCSRIARQVSSPPLPGMPTDGAEGVRQALRSAGIEVLDSFKLEPFDLRIALPDEAGPIVALAPADDGSPKVGGGDTSPKGPRGR